MKKQFYFIALFLVIVVLTEAQTRSCLFFDQINLETSENINEVFGKVVNKNSGEPICFATVSVDKKNTTTTTTDLEGKYFLKASLNDTLSFNMAGMKTQRIKVDKKEINIQLEEVETIDVVFGPPYYPKTKRLEATTTITKKDIENVDNPKYNFKKNANNNVFVIFVSELTSYDFNKEDIKFQQKYNVNYSLIGNYETNYLVKYNKLTFKYLKKKYKHNWLTEIRKDAVGLNKK